MPATAGYSAQDAADAQRAEINRARELAFTLDGFDCYPRYPDRGGAPDAWFWQVRASRAAQAAYEKATGQRWDDSDIGPVTAAELRRQIEDIIGATKV